MTAEALLTALLRENIVASAAVVAVLVVRPWALARLGPKVVYWLWVVVPVAVCASLLPARSVIVTRRIAHAAAARLRADQELACDAAVIAVHPGSRRRSYGRALLKAQLDPRALRLGCAWTSRSARQLTERIEALGRPAPSRRRVRAGAGAITALGLCLAYAAWAQQAPRLVAQAERPDAVWTPAAEAPPDTLSHALEGERHDFFIELAQRGDIELVFFGTTDTEMWWWQRGRDVWEREFGALKAANFGSQGTHSRSLLWRMRNGELDGYEAELIVLQAWGQPSAIADADRNDYVAGFVPIIGEILARQPRAKLLIMAPLPRSGPVERWRQQTASFDAAMSELADDETIFYANLGADFFDADGAFKGETWRGGRRAPGFEIWAEALQPWLDRFVR
jgi:hypothetical protein